MDRAIPVLMHVVRKEVKTAGVAALGISAEASF
jgi:hypothetical protein